MSRTLADMTPEEREKCQWMQCEVDGVLTGVIVHIGGENAVILWRSGMRSKHRFLRVTPRPDLPRMVWPGSEPDDTPESPRKTLVTEEDYRNAPTFTVVKKHPDGPVLEKVPSRLSERWKDNWGNWFTSDELADTAREVIWEP